MAIVTYPLNNINYSAEDAELFHCTRTSGVFAADEDFNASVTGTNNVVTIGQGVAWIRNSKFSGKVVANKTAVSVDMGLANGTYNRIDAIVLQFSASQNKTSIIRKQGTASTSPKAPAITQTESVYELHLYHVYRRAGATSIVASDITDLRANRNYCGVMSDDVTMLGDDFISQDMIGVANGVASLNSSGKIPSNQLPSMDYIPTSQKGAAGGVASLDSKGKVLDAQLPPMDYIPTSKKGVANGVASLGGDGKVPKAQLPPMDYIPTSKKGAANGVASLGGDGRVPSDQLPSMDYIQTSQKGAANGVAPLNSSLKLDNKYAFVEEFTGDLYPSEIAYATVTVKSRKVFRTGAIVFAIIGIKITPETAYNQFQFTLSGLPNSAGIGFVSKSEYDVYGLTDFPFETSNRWTAYFPTTTHSFELKADTNLTAGKDYYAKLSLIYVTSE